MSVRRDGRPADAFDRRLSAAVVSTGRIETRP
jgi:hypothetical protein